jgi:DNA polymerase-3 subunit alpha
MCFIEDVVDTCKKYNMPAVAITDHGNLFGAMELYKKATAENIKPIIGYEAYLAPDTRLNRSKQQYDGMDAYHLVLLAKDLTGYKNLIKLTSKAYTEGFYYRPRIDKELLKEHCEGLIALTACLKGEIARDILNDNSPGETLKEYIDIFGKENLFLEIQNHNIKEERQIIPHLIELSRKYEVGLVATNDVHYIKREDSKAHDCLLCIQTNSKLDEEKRLRFNTDQVYFKSPQEMKRLFEEIPEAITNTRKIADMVSLSLDEGEYHLPGFPLPDGITEKEYLKKLCFENISVRYKEKNPEIEERINYELSIIDQLDFNGYFLIVQDIVNFARRRGISVGPGRGSAAGSIVSYLLGITSVDPLKHSLIFERFLNPDRISMPDIDIDFSDIDRGEIINYITETYGNESVAQIVTFGRLKARAAIRDIGRVMGLPYGEVDRLAKMIPFSLDITIDKAMKENPRITELYESDENIKTLIDLAKRIEGIARNTSIHAAGIVIAPGYISDYIPIMKTGNDEIATQFTMDIVEERGLLKLDVLGLRTLSNIDKAIQYIKENRGIDIDIEDIDMKDSPTYQLISSGHTDGIFQLESRGMRDLCLKIAPDNFRELAPILGLFRPGPLGSGMIEDYTARKKGEKKVEYNHPLLEPILKETYGVIVYQEQVMQIANQLAGFSHSDADTLRKVMSKKDVDSNVMLEKRKEFILGCAEKNIPENKAREIYDVMSPFARYGFNKSHTISYAYITYWTAYLKANFPREFMASLLTVEASNSKKVAKYISDARDMEIDILPPSINKSYHHFNVENNSIRFGLIAIKNMGSKAINSIVTERDRNGDYESLVDFTARVDLTLVNKRAIESLIKAGAFDEINDNRKALFKSIGPAMEIGAKITTQHSQDQFSLLSSDEIKPEHDITPKTSDWNPDKRLTLEKDILGFYLSEHPISSFKDEIENIITSDIQNITDEREGSDVVIAGMIVGYKQIKDRRGRDMAFITIEDEKASIEGIVFSGPFSKAEVYLYPNSMVVVCGRLEKTDEIYKIIVNEVYPIREARKKMATSIHIKIPEVIQKSEKTLKNIYNAVVNGRMDEGCKVYIHIPYNGKETIARMPPNFRLPINELLFEELSRILGDKELIWYDIER